MVAVSLNKEAPMEVIDIILVIGLVLVSSILLWRGTRKKAKDGCCEG